MFYVICPVRESTVEISENAVGPERSDPWNVIGCDNCGCTFDYDDDEVRTST
jgi:hypothetical protein